jgi:putative DNA primase/helicase
MGYLQSRPDLRARCTRHFAANVVANLEGVCALDTSVNAPAWIDGRGPCDPRQCVTLENGILDIDALMAESEDVLRPHTPVFFSMNALPYSFDPGIPCPLWQEVLERVLPDPAARDLLQEWYGYCLLPGTRLHKFIVLLGEGANGKSVVCKVLAGLLGERNISSVPIERFRETHNLSGTLGKLANIISEFEEIDRATEGTLKSFVSGDPMEFNPKYKPTFTARPTARLIAATNNLPHVKDKSSGLWRRMIVLHFPVQIPEDEQDPQLVEKLEVELPGILNWSLVGLFRLLKRGHLVEPASSVAAREEHRRVCNSARLFIEENLCSIPGRDLAKHAVYSDYQSFCKDRGFSPMNEAHFAQEVYRYFPGKVTTARRRMGVDSVRTYVYDGLAWGTDDDGPGGPSGPGDSENFLDSSASCARGASGPGGPSGPGDSEVSRLFHAARDA